MNKEAKEYLLFFLTSKVERESWPIPVKEIPFYKDETLYVMALIRKDLNNRKVRGIQDAPKDK